MAEALLSRNRLIKRDQIEEVYGSVPSLPTDTYSQSNRPPSDSPSLSCRWIHKIKYYIEDYFELHKRKVDAKINPWKTEFHAAVADYFTMAYILAVNSSILTQTGGTTGTCAPTQPPSCAPTQPPSFHESESFCAPQTHACLQNLRLQLITATALSIFVSSFIMGIAANRPFALAPGMGMNAYFVYTVVGTYSSSKGLTYEAALLATLIEGIIFLFLSLLGFTKHLSKIPPHMKCAIAAGIGLFLARIGLEKDQGIGFIHENSISFGWDTILGIICLSIMVIFSLRKLLWGSMLIAMVITTLSSKVYCGVQLEDFEKLFSLPMYSFDIPLSVIELIPNLIFHHGSLTTDPKTFGPGYVQFIEAIITFLVVDILDTASALYGLADYAKILDENKDFERSKHAFCADALGTIAGSLLGTSPVTTFLESSSGIHRGGRTGLTAIFVSVFFALSTFAGPIFASIPRYATGPCLIIIGLMNLKFYIGNINWSSSRILIPSGLTMIIMPFSKSITYGILAGVAADVVIKSMDWFVDFWIWRFGDCCCCCCCECGRCEPRNMHNDRYNLNGNGHQSASQITELFKTKVLGMASNDELDIPWLKNAIKQKNEEEERDHMQDTIFLIMTEEKNSEDMESTTATVSVAEKSRSSRSTTELAQLRR